MCYCHTVFKSELQGPEKTKKLLINYLINPKLCFNMYQIVELFTINTNTVTVTL